MGFSPGVKNFSVAQERNHGTFWPKPRTLTSPTPPTYCGLRSSCKNYCYVMHLCMLGQAAAGARVCLIVCVCSRYSSRTKGAGRGFAKHVEPPPPCSYCALLLTRCLAASSSTSPSAAGRGLPVCGRHLRLARRLSLLRATSQLRELCAPLTLSCWPKTLFCWFLFLVVFGLAF